MITVDWAQDCWRPMPQGDPNCPQQRSDKDSSRANAETAAATRLRNKLIPIPYLHHCQGASDKAFDGYRNNSQGRRLNRQWSWSRENTKQNTKTNRGAPVHTNGLNIPQFAILLWSRLVEFKKNPPNRIFASTIYSCGGAPQRLFT